MVSSFYYTFGGDVYITFMPLFSGIEIPSWREEEVFVQCIFLIPTHGFLLDPFLSSFVGLFIYSLFHPLLGFCIHSWALLYSFVGFFARFWVLALVQVTHIYWAYHLL